MLMGLIWTAMIVVSVLFGCLNGTVGQVQQAALEGAQAAIELCIVIGGAVCLWCAVMELMRASGLAEALSHALRPILRRLFPESARHEAVLQPLSANVSANLLGLGNAATPMGIAAMHALEDENGFSSGNRSMVRFVVINTASLQLFPTSLGALRAAAGCANPFDILPAVWLVSALSLAVALAACFALEGRHA